MSFLPRRDFSGHRATILIIAARAAVACEMTKKMGVLRHYKVIIRWPSEKLVMTLIYASK